MKKEKSENPALSSHSGFLHRLDRSAILTLAGVVFLFSFAIIITLIAPRYVDSTWTSPSSAYQVQMYEIEDPHFYLSTAATGGKELQYVRHLKAGFTLLAFKESNLLRFVAPPELEPYITRHEEEQLKLTSHLLFLREPQKEMKEKEDALRQQLVQAHVQEGEKPNYQIFELYDPQMKEAFSFDPSGGIIGNWVDENFKILEESVEEPYHRDVGVVYVHNPQEFRIRLSQSGGQEGWQYDPAGRPIKDLEELKSPLFCFSSRQELIELGEHIYAIEGCWYCHTDQTRTLVQDTVLNGSDSHPAPPSSANEYIYQKITFAGTRRVGPDLSRVGVKRPSRDWHASHFWTPKTASVGSIMPAFQHFFDVDRNVDSQEINKNHMGIPNREFEAVYQYMMTKGTRITPPTQAWWLGMDPIQTKEIIEGQRTLR